MSEESERVGSGPEGNGAGVDPTAVALALAGASREKADAFLEKQDRLADEQIALTRLQAKELAHELKLRHWSFQLRHASALLKFALEVSLALIGIGLACFLGAVVWNAAHADGLVIEQFSVPPDLASRGITGQVVASQMQDKLLAMQNQTISAGATISVGAAKQLTNGWGDTINVQIPDTGISISEAYRFLRGWLGHETHLSGEVYRTTAGIAITVRTGGDSGATFAGSESDLDRLIQKAAENVYKTTQPARYVRYLREHYRSAEAIPIMRTIAETGPTPLDRAIGYVNWANDAGVLSGLDVQVRLYERGADLGTDYPAIWQNLGRLQINRSVPEQALPDLKKANSFLSSHGYEFYTANEVPLLKKLTQALIDSEMGDFRESSREFEDVIHGGLRGFVGLFENLAMAQIGGHELSAARATMTDATVTGTNPETAVIYNTRVRMLLDGEVHNWAGILSDAIAYAPIVQKFPGWRTNLPRVSVPFTAYAEARLGKISDAEKHIATTPADCYDCLIMRARIADLERQDARADWWFDRAAHAAPSIPFAYNDWGHALLERDKPDAAIAQFTIAHQKGPHFADPLEGWGEALMAKNQSHLALAKFAEADKYAPNWGRLHLKWGEALVYAGKPDEARAQFARAAQLDLTPAEKSELAGVNGHV